MTSIKNALFELLYHSKPDSEHVSEFKIPGKRDRYFHVGTGKSDSGKLSESDVTGIPGFWADIDIGSEGHKGKKYPDTIEIAMELLSGLYLKPNAIVATGGGLHCYWIFREFWLFENEGQSRYAAILSAKWQALVRHLFSRRGFTIDNTSDLCRILRIPDSLNYKYHPPRLVSVVESNSNFANLSEYEAHLELVDEPVSISIKKSEFAGIEIDMNPNTGPPFLKFDTLLTLDPKFRATWNEKRKDLADRSPSGYSASLAFLAAHAGWTDQEIVDLVVAWRKKHGHAMKLDRIDWYRRLVHNTRQTIMAGRGESASVTLQGNAEPDVKPAQAQPTEIAERLEVPIVALERHGKEAETYFLRLEGGQRIEIGSITSLVSYKFVATRIFRELGRFPKPVKEKIWHQILEILAPSMEIHEHRDESPEYQVSEWISSYAFSINRSTLRPKPQLIFENLPVIEGDSVFIHAGNFINWIRENRDKSVLPGKVRQWIAMIGGQQTPMEGCIQRGESKQRAFRRYWRLEKNRILGEQNEKT